MPSIFGISDTNKQLCLARIVFVGYDMHESVNDIHTGKILLPDGLRAMIYYIHTCMHIYITGSHYYVLSNCS